MGNNAAKKLKGYVERIERLEDEKAATAEDIREVYKELKSDGFDPRVLRLVMRLRKRESQELSEEMALLDTYLRELGMTPLERLAAGETAEK